MVQIYIVRFLQIIKAFVALITYNYFNNFYLYGINANYVLFALLEILLFVYYFKNKEKYNSNLILLFFILYAMLLYIVFSESIEFLYNLKYVNGVVSLIFILLIMLLMFILFKKKYTFKWEIFATMIFVISPLIIVSPIEARNFLIIYVLLMILILKLFYELFGNIKTE